MKKKIVLNICITNFLLAVSSTIGMTIIPLIAVDTLGLSFLVLGIIEGLAEFFSSTLRFYSGLFFDKEKNKLKLLIYPIYLALISKLVLLHPNTIMIIATKFIERLSNGSFGPLRDALVLKLSLTKGGFDLSLLNISKSLGCLLGPVLVSLCMTFNGQITILIYLCILFCVLALIIVYYLQALPVFIDKVEESKFTFNKEDLKALKPIYPILILSIIFFLSRFNDGLIIFVLRNYNFPEWFYLSTIGIFNAFMLIISPFIGKFLDTGKTKVCLYFTIMSMILFNILSYNLESMNLALGFLILFFWGAQRVSSQMTFLFLIKQKVPSDYLGRAIGLYSLLTGISVFIAAGICGFLAKYAFSYVFIYSVGCSVLALFCLIFIFKDKKM